MLRPTLPSLCDPNGLLNPNAVAARLGVDLNGLAALIRMHRNSLYRLPHGSQGQEKMSEVVRILTRAAALMDKHNSDIKAVMWFRNQPIAGFGNKTAMELVREGHVAAVRAHLSVLENGGYA